MDLIYGMNYLNSRGCMLMMISGGVPFLWQGSESEERGSCDNEITVCYSQVVPWAVRSHFSIRVVPL